METKERRVALTLILKWWLTPAEEATVSDLDSSEMIGSQKSLLNPIGLIIEGVNAVNPEIYLEVGTDRERKSNK